MNLKTYRRNSVLTFSILCGICVLAVLVIVILKLTNTIKSPAFEILLILPIYIFVLLGTVLYFEYRGKLVIDCSKLIIYYKTFSSKKFDFSSYFKAFKRFPQISHTLLILLNNQLYL